MPDKLYHVGWNEVASTALAKLFNIDPYKVFKRSKQLLSLNPYKQAHGVADYPGFEFNGYYWTLIHNVIVLYRVSDEKKTVFIEACFFANTELSHEIFWDIDPSKE